MSADTLLADLHARGIHVVADGEVLKCRPRSAMTASDISSLQQQKQAVLDLLVAGKPAPSLRVVCYGCKGRRFWRSIHGVVICGKCHPPAAPHLVDRWLETSTGAPYHG